MGEQRRYTLLGFLQHNKDHIQEYESLAEELESVGEYESARSIHEVTALIAQSNECLNYALKAI